MIGVKREADLLRPVSDYFRRKGFRWQTTELQFYEYNIDVYAAAPASDNIAGGYHPVDQTSILDLHRIVRLVRNIIMHPDNTYLGLTQVVGSKTGNLIGRRWITSKEIFQPQIGDRPVQGVIACRIPLSVSFPEIPVNASFDTIELISVTAKRAVDGKVILEADFDTT